MITQDNWSDRWEDVQPGTEVSQDVYDQMFNVLPPILLCKSPYSGFQMGEANDHREDENGRWRARFLTFVTSGGRFFYAGIHFGGECPMDFELHKENN